jgi:heme/copper-type cytochrome/quinol oxidase subunit 1
MSRRELAFLLIGLGIGLSLAVAVVIEFVLWLHHMFVVGISWRPASAVLAVPIVLVLIGSILLYRSSRQRNSG